MNPTPPEHIIVLASCYRIVLATAEWHVQTVDGRWGECDYSAKEIKIPGWLPVQEQAATLLHEIDHAIHFEMSLDDKCTEEDYAERGSRGRAAVFRVNPGLLTYLIEVYATPV